MTGHYFSRSLHGLETRDGSFELPKHLSSDPSTPRDSRYTRLQRAAQCSFPLSPWAAACSPCRLPNRTASLSFRLAHAAALGAYSNFRETRQQRSSRFTWLGLICACETVQSRAWGSRSFINKWVIAVRSLGGGISTATCVIESPPKSDISTMAQAYVFHCLLIADGSRI